MKTVTPLRALLCASLFSAVAHAQDFPNRPIRIVVPFTPGGLDASSEQGSRLRDVNVRESAAAAVLIAQISTSHEQFPNRPIRIVVPFTPGGATDVVTRIVAQKLSEQFARQVVTDNRGGAGGIVGAEFVARAPADGYTLVMGTSGTHAINVSLYPRLSYDPVKDFAPITRVSLLPSMIVVHPSVPAKNVRELIALAKKNPGQLTYASSGSAQYLTGALFTSMAGIEMVHVPYKGGGQALPAQLGGEVALSFSTVVSSLPHVTSGRLRGLAVTSAKRTPAAPDFPTVAESGLPGYEAVSWYGLFAPAGTPRDIIARLNAETVRVLKLADVRQLMLAQGAEPVSETPEQFAALVKADIAKWGEVVRKSGARAD